MIILTISFALIFITYNWLMFHTFGSLWSISEGYYHLSGRSPGGGNIFTMFLYIIASFLFGITAYTENLWFILAAAGAIFVGVAATYKQKITETVHYSGSAMLMGGAAFGCWFAMGNWWVVASILIAGIATWILWRKIKSPLYWFEQFTFGVIILGLLI